MNNPTTEYFKTFKARIPKSRYGNKVDSTRMRFVDTATEDELREEYNKILNKTSNLPSTERSIISKFFANEA
jgi:hypothetical protein